MDTMLKRKSRPSGPKVEKTAIDMVNGTSCAQISTLQPTSLVASDHLLTKIGTKFHLPSLIFDARWYQDQNPDVVAANLDPVKHYLENGYREGRNPNKYFDTNWYASRHIDVAATGLNPFLHYLLYGAMEGHLPAP